MYPVTEPPEVFWDERRALPITESLAEMIKYVANEPSVGLFYVQQHTQNAVPNVINLKNNVVEKSRQTNLHTEDLEDSITTMRSMKECGFPIADEMIRDIRKSLALMSTRKPRRGLIDNQSSGFLPGRTRSWGPASWANSRAFAQHDTKGGGNYFSTVLKTAREKAGNFQWPQPDAKEVTPSEGDKLLSYPTPSQLVESASTSSSIPDVEIDELPLSSQAADESQMPDEDEQPHTEAQPGTVLFVSEDYDDFKANKEAKLEEWLGETGNNVDKSQETT